MDHIAVPAGDKDILPVRRDSEVSWMDAGFLITHIFKEPGLAILFEYSYTVTFQTIAGIKELAVRGEMYVGASPRMERIGLDGLYQL